MQDGDDIKRFSLESLQEQRKRGETLTRADAPLRSVDEDFWSSAKVVMPPSKASVHLRVDADVLEWFKAQGKGHLTRMNAVLRSFMTAHKSSSGDHGS